MKKHPLFRVLLAVLILGAALASAESSPHTVLYFYRNYCESCTPEEDFADQFLSLTGIRLDECDFKAWNVVRQDGQKELEETAARLKLSSVSLPLAIVDGIVYQGAAEMNTALAQNALSWQDSNDSVLLYLYTPACESCAAADAALASLPAKVEIHRGDVTIESPVSIERIDISASPDFAQLLFDLYAVEDSRRITPAVFFGKHFLTGARDITEKLSQEVALGWASEKPLFPDPETSATAAEIRNPAPLLTAIGAGLIAGLNTCALSMLLLFLSLILPTGRKAPVIFFLGAKFLCYLLIGFIFIEVFQRFNPSWLRPAARWIMTLLGIILIILTLSDAFHASRGELGSIRNQLPSPLRGKLRRVIQQMTKSRFLLPASALLGFLVAGGEFMCAGQLYLMQLISSARLSTGQGLALAVYCLAFLFPSAAVSAVVFKTRSHLRAASFFAGHMTAVKILTSIAMAGLILYAWFI